MKEMQQYTCCITAIQFTETLLLSLNRSILPVALLVVRVGMELKATAVCRSLHLIHYPSPHTKFCFLFINDDCFKMIEQVSYCSLHRRCITSGVSYLAS
jgi:hypothetical protein